MTSQAAALAEVNVPASIAQLSSTFALRELPPKVINHIIEHQETLTATDVEVMIVKYFRANRCKELKRIVRSWNELPYFKCREGIFHEALVNHSRKYFNSSVTVLTIHTEGVITDFTRIQLKNPRFRLCQALEDITEELAQLGEVSLYEHDIFCDTIERIKEAFNENFAMDNPEEASNSSRHKIAHGHAYDKETELNSLKCFLYLNEVYYLFLRLKK